MRDMPLAIDVDAVPEGTVVFPHEPLVRVRGPLVQSQVPETLLLNLIGFQTLVATKAARVVMAACGEPVLEFGLRRAQGIDGAMAASRAAYAGGLRGDFKRARRPCFRDPRPWHSRAQLGHVLRR